MEDDLFWIALGNSLYFALMTTAGNVVVALCAALALKSIRLGHTLFRVAMYAPVVLSISVIGIIFSRLLAPFGLLNAGLELFGHDGFNYLADPNLVLPSLSLTTIWWGFGFPMLIFWRRFMPCRKRFTKRRALMARGAGRYCGRSLCLSFGRRSSSLSSPSSSPIFKSSASLIS